MFMFIALFLLAVLVYTAYKARPKPIPGIPHNPGSEKSIFGDVFAIMKSATDTGETFNWLAAQTERLQSPIVQVFARPFCQPWVVVTDFRESQDILLRRTAEFDRSTFAADMLDGVVPDHHIHMLMKNPMFVSNRNLIKDLMTPTFLHTVAAPQMYASVLHLLELWQLKMRHANGRAFSAPSDIFHCAFDIVFWVTFGRRKNLSAVLPQVELLKQTTPTVSESGNVVKFEIAELPGEFEAINTLSDSFEASVKSPLPRQTHWVLRQLPSYKRANMIKERMLDEEISHATKAFNPGMERAQQTSAMEDVLWREYTAARKENRAPDYNQPGLRDELFGFLIAGVDTTSTTMAWALKFLADDFRVQTKLRQSLREAYHEAYQAGRLPTYDEIIKRQVPYLECVLEEIVRLMRTTGGVARQALVDTEVLGHKIPKGTDVFLMCNGASFWKPAMEINPSLRQKSALSAKLHVPEWDPRDIADFKPERWLTQQEGSSEPTFNPMAGPAMNFGLGPRGCYGRRLAYLELRMMVVMIVWEFALDQCPAELSSYKCIEKVTGQPQQCYVRLSTPL